MLLNRIAGSSDEMASLINLLSKSFNEIEHRCEAKMSKKDEEILNLKTEIYESKSISKEEKESFLKRIECILDK